MESTIFQFQDIEKYTNEFQLEKKVQIPMILKEEVAEQLFKYCVLEKNWTLSTGFDQMKFQKKVGKPFEKANAQQIKKVQDKFKNDHFSYIFHRSMNNDTPSYIEFSIRKMMSSPAFIESIQQITGLEVTELSTLFLSKYRGGHFLSPHSDKGNGKLAFVLHLTKGWKPQYGGLLHFMNTKKTEVVRTFCPQFNQLTIFEVPEKGIPHYVSHVVPYIKQDRFAITGWYK